MAKTIKDSVEIPAKLLKHLVRLTGNNQAKSLLRKHLGVSTVGTASPVGNIAEEVAATEVKPKTKAAKEKAEAKPKTKTVADKTFSKG